MREMVDAAREWTAREAGLPGRPDLDLQSRVCTECGRRFLWKRMYDGDDAPSMCEECEREGMAIERDCLEQGNEGSWGLF